MKTAALLYLSTESPARRMTTEDFKTLRLFRVQAQGSHPVPPEEIFDSHDPHSVHFWEIRASQLAGVARLCIHTSLEEAPDARYFKGLGLMPPTPIACFNRLLIAPSFRRDGIAKKLNLWRLVYARAHCKSAIVCTHLEWLQKMQSEAGFQRAGKSNLSSLPETLQFIRRNGAAFVIEF